MKVKKDPYPVDALPTCNHALSVCQQERKCIKLFEDFKLHCKVRENKCRMEDSSLGTSALQHHTHTYSPPGPPFHEQVNQLQWNVSRRAVRAIAFVPDSR
uniref:GDNF/GAS1 domain-containing protein n=1 Tax=Anopheles epiroticus TaxID=199890 RepID=A0A182P372_9DIPT